MTGTAERPMAAANAALERHVAERRAMFYPKADVAVADATLRALAAPGPQALEPAAHHARMALAHTLGASMDSIAAHPLAQQGTFHFVFEGGRRESHERFVVRLNRLPEELVDWQLLADERASAALSRTVLRHAQVRLVDCTRSIVPTDFEVLERLEGESLSVHDESDAAIAPWLARLAIVLRRVHEIRGEGFGFIDVSAPSPTHVHPLRGVHGRWDDYVSCRLREHVEALTGADIVSGSEASAIEHAFESARDDLARVEPRLLHGDTGNHNVIVREGEAPALVDWEDALLGDPLFDVAFWATFHPERRWAAFFDAYFPAGWRPTRLFWLYFLRVALSKTVHRLRFGYTDRPGRPPASARIQRALAGLEETRGRA